MSRPDEHLSAAIRKLMRLPLVGATGQSPRQPSPLPRPAHDSQDWKQCIESELDSMNRRLSAIESRLTIVFYLVVVLTVVVCVTDVSAARQILESVISSQ